MARSFAGTARARSSRRLILVFAATILLPALLLGFFGLRALLKESELADQEIRRRLEAAADDADLGLRQQFLEWQQFVDIWTADPTGWPARLRAAVAEPGQAVVLRAAQGHLHAYPKGQILCALGGVAPASAPVPGEPLWTNAEAAELHDKDYAGALEFYTQLLKQVSAAERPIVLHRLARCARKAGRENEARTWFRELAQAASVRIGSLPSDLLARYEISDSPAAQLDLYKDLVTGRWELEKASYYYYSASLRERLGPGEEEGLRTAELSKLALSEAAARFLETLEMLVEVDGSYFLAFWKEKPLTAILLSEAFVHSEVLPQAFHNLDGRDLAVSLQDMNGNSLFGSPPPAGEMVVTRAVNAAGLPVQLRLWPQDSSTLYEDANRRRSLYLGMLAGIVGLLAFGGYLTLRTARAEIAMAQLKSDFVSTVSHEFRSPLTGVHQLAEMLRDGRVPDEVRRRQYYDMIVNETQRLRRLVENVLDFSRIEEGRKKYNFEPFEPSPWLRGLAAEFEQEVAGNGFTVETELLDELPLLTGDREALSTAVRNLLDNAVKYSGTSRTVWLQSSASGASLSITVRDRGIGITAQEREHIFERFYRGGENRETVKGVGLGLNLVASIVAAHGGAVDVESTPGEGSRFTIRLRTGDS